MLQKMGDKPDKAKLQKQIDENLQRVYREALEADVPDRFKSLIEQLRAKESGK